MVDDAAGRVEVDVEVPTSGVLVVADTWYPGWKAFVDGVEVTLSHAHGVFQRIAIPGGRHRVVLSYAPVTEARISVITEGGAHRRACAAATEW